jgi:hypothetical protein
MALILLSSCCSSSDKVRHTSTIRGTVNYGGVAVQKKRINLSRFPECDAQHPGGLFSENLILGSANELESAIVYLIGKPSDDQRFETEEKAFLRVEKCRFVPRVIGVRSNQGIYLTNSDKFPHAYHSVGRNNPPMSVVLPPGDSASRIALKEEDSPLSVRCDIHPWEQAWILVIPHSHFSVTGPSGNYEIKNVPSGRYVLECWHESCLTQRKEITVTEGSDITLNFKLARKLD